MNRLQKMLEERAAAWSKVQDIRTRLERDGRDPSDEENETYERGLADVERLSKDIEREERADRAERTVDQLGEEQRSTTPKPDKDDDPNTPDVSEVYRSGFDAYLRRGMEGVRGEARDALEKGLVEFDEARAGGVGVDAAGGYTVPKEFLQRMTEALKDFGGIVSVAEIINTQTGASLQWPTSDDTNNKGAILDENTQVTEQDFVFGTTGLRAFMYTSKMVRISYQLLQDSAFNLDAWLPRKLGERIGRATAEHFAVGDGTGKPQGLFTGLQSAVTSASATKIGYDDLIDLEHSIDTAYRNNAGYLGSDSAIAAIRKLKNDQGNPLWQPSLTAGVPSTINGRPYTVDNNIPAFAAGAAPLAYGDFRQAYVVRIVNGAQTLRLTERYADFLQVGFLGFQRLDGKVQNAAAAKKLTIKAA